MTTDLSPSVPQSDLDADCVRLAYAHLPSIAISAMVSSIVLAWIGHAEVSTLRIVAGSANAGYSAWLWPRASMKWK